MTTKKQKVGGGGRKIGRNKAFCKRYELEGRRRKNKLVKVGKHVKNHPNDLLAKAFLD